jgi:hypothetical protein
VKPKLPPGHTWSDHIEPNHAWTHYEQGHKFHSLKTIQERLSVMAYSNIQQTLNDLKQKGTRWSPIHQTSSLTKTPKQLGFNQYITMTDVKQDNSLNSSEVSSIAADTFESIKSQVKENILLFFAKQKELNIEHELPIHPDTYRPESLEEEKAQKNQLEATNAMIKIIMNTCATALASQESNSHLVNAQYATNANIRGFWKRCGFKEQAPRGLDKMTNDIIGFQYEDVAAYQIKCDMPLSPMYNLNSSESLVEDSSENKPVYCSTKTAFNPVVYKIHTDHILPMQTPGHWFGDQREFNFLTVLNTTRQINYFKSKFLNKFREDFENFKSMAITSAHAELTAQAYYLGFSMWKDLTYPLIGQYVLTNGQDVCFAKYQLNTLSLWNEANKRKNLCHISVPERLWEMNEDRSEIIKFNDDLLKRILNLLATQPIKRGEEICSNYSELDHMLGGTRLRPYLSVKDINDQLSPRHRLLATSLYELVKYDRPVTYLNMRTDTVPDGMMPKFVNLYSKLTYDYKDIVLDYYPRDFFGAKLVERMFYRRHPKEKENFWDLKVPVYEWANVPPPHTNNIKRVIDLEKF